MSRRHRLLNGFTNFAGWSAHAIGSPNAFVIAVAACIIWALTGPLFGFSDTWQLIINTGTTVVTFLTVFLIQHTQNRDNQAVQLKLDELIRTTAAARDGLIDVESLSDEEIKALQEEFARRRFDPDYDCTLQSEGKAPHGESSEA